ncbi:MAG TPA: SUF system NifU family Fe-S cluster assembly protein, partial [Erysipelotrichaceae bacterium]|nr:SUF system NifU family Fe-S cluster assembly protein [Erysipelotrichaceae bacterium]
MHSLDNPLVMREIIMDHYKNPRNHGIIDDDAYMKTNMNSSTCIDNIDIEAKFNGDMIEDVRFDGEACAISTASTSIMTELV